jgi:origin recognition complex subunit 4
MSSPAMTRKRSRAYLEEDELSPEKDKSTTPLSGTKKRKLNTNGSSPGSGTIIGGIKRRIGGLLSWGGKGKENAKVDEDADELANDGNEEAEKDIWAVPDDDETRGNTGRSRRNGSERTSAVSTPNKKQTPVKSTKSRKANEKATPTKDGSATDIWEVPDEDIPSARRSGRKGASSVDRVKATLAPVEQEDSPVKRSPGRPKKSQILKEDKKLSKLAKREKLIAAQEDSDGDEESIATPTKHRKAVGKGESLEESLQRSGGTSTSRRRGRPRKGSVDTVDAAQQVPKGILTPKKDRTLKSRKSVAFQDDGEVDLGFKDIPSSVSAKKSKRTSKLGQEVVVEISGAKNPRTSELEKPGDEVEEIPIQEDDVESEGEDDEEDDEKCVVCSKPDFTKKNQILFCDSCDLGYHQACYEIEKLPKKNEDWFCRNCQPGQELGITFDQLGNASGLEAPNNLPDIDGFEKHLRNMQRILLDKLTSQKRVKLQGHDEEMQKVYQVVEQTVLAGEGNSMLVIGARGSGKTTVGVSI